MTKLNNKGITTIEVILCFVIVVIITMSMFATVSSFNEKRIIEKDKEEIYSYKNILTKEIQDDFIKIGLTHASYERTVNGATTTHIVRCELKDGTNRELVISQTLAKSSYHIGGTEGASDNFYIEYGPSGDRIRYPLPDLGNATQDGKVKNLSINNVLINITDENVLSIYIGFYHPELTTRYAISIVAPIDYLSFSGNDGTKWTY